MFLRIVTPLRHRILRTQSCICCAAHETPPPPQTSSSRSVPRHLPAQYSRHLPLSRSIHTTRHDWIDVLSSITTTPTSSSPSSPSNNPSPSQQQQQQPTSPTPLTEKGYHALSTRFFDDLVQKLEDMAEEQEGLDVEYSVRLCSARFIVHLDRHLLLG